MKTKPDILKWQRKLSHKSLFFLAIGLVALGILQLRSDSSRISRRPDAGYPVARPQECGNDDEKNQKVFEWVKTHGAWIHSNLSIGSFSIADAPHVIVRGLAATGDILEGDIARIPQSLMLNLETVRNDATFASIYNSTPEMHDGLGGLAAFLIYQALNVSSFWRPYLCSLPTHVPLPIFYAPKRKNEMYRSEVRPQFKDYFDKILRKVHLVIESRFLKIMPVLIEKYPHIFDEARFSRARWAWACAIILSRTWGRPIEDTVIANKTGLNKTVVHTLVPAADMPNHDNSARPAQFRVVGDETVLVLYASRKYQAGDQVHISYGNKCNEEFLINYGFIPSNNSNVECHAFNWTSITNDTRTRNQAKPMQEHSSMDGLQVGIK